MSDDVLNDGVERKSSPYPYQASMPQPMDWGKKQDNPGGHSDSGSYSRYFDLDSWSKTLPFLITPKASKSEKNKGLDLEPRTTQSNLRSQGGLPKPEVEYKAKNFHPTVKPLKLMSYLITLFSRPGDTVLDPFVGSGTTLCGRQRIRPCSYWYRT